MLEWVGVKEGLCAAFLFIVAFLAGYGFGRSSGRRASVPGKETPPSAAVAVPAERPDGGAEDVREWDYLEVDLPPDAELAPSAGTWDYLEVDLPPDAATAHARAPQPADPSPAQGLPSVTATAEADNPVAEAALSPRRSSSAGA